MILVVNENEVNRKQYNSSPILKFNVLFDNEPKHTWAIMFPAVDVKNLGEMYTVKC